MNVEQQVLLKVAPRSSLKEIEFFSGVKTCRLLPSSGSTQDS